MSNKRILKAYERFDYNGKVVPGSLVLRSKMPKNGKWKELVGYECCVPLNTGILLQENGDNLLQEDSSDILL